MRIKDLFRVILKTLGIYFLILILIPSLLRISFVFEFQQDFSMAMWYLIPNSVYTLLFYLLVFKTDSIIQWFKLESQFEDKTMGDLNLSGQKILMLAIIIIGGIVFIQALPSLITYLILAFKNSVQLDYSGNRTHQGFKDNINWISEFFNVLIGFLLITNSTRLSKWLNKEFEEKMEPNSES